MKFNQSKVSNGFKAWLYCQKPNTNICFVVAFDTNELKNLSIMEINFSRAKNADILIDFINQNYNEVLKSFASDMCSEHNSNFGSVF